MPPTPDKMERARRDKRFKLAQKELEPMFSEMINKFMAEKGRPSRPATTRRCSRRTTWRKMAGLNVDDKFFGDNPKMLEGLNPKGFDMKFGELSTFFDGLEQMIGLPAAGFLKKVMRDEHCDRDDSDSPFETMNYHLKTTSHIEWWFVVDPARGREELNKIDCYKERHLGRLEAATHRWPSEEGRCARGARRQPQPLEDFEALVRAVNMKLQEEGYKPLLEVEFIGARLYTGPMFRACAAASSSASRRRRSTSEVALTYAGKRRLGGIVYEIQMGMIDRGADISWLSQYPHEKEILFAPLTGLEMISCWQKNSARTLQLGQRMVTFIELRLSINLTNKTIEEVQAKMQSAHLQLLDDLKSDLQMAPTRALVALDGLRSGQSMREPDWFNVPQNFRAANEVAFAELKAVFTVLGDIDLWDAEEAEKIGRSRKITDDQGHVGVSDDAQQDDEGGRAVCARRRARERGPAAAQRASGMGQGGRRRRTATAARRLPKTRQSSCANGQTRSYALRRLVPGAPRPGDQADRGRQNHREGPRPAVARHPPAPHERGRPHRQEVCEVLGGEVPRQADGGSRRGRRRSPRRQAARRRGGARAGRQEASTCGGEGVVKAVDDRRRR